MSRIHTFSCGPGWAHIIKPAIDYIESHGGKIVQVKEKFGGLRIYFDIPEGESWEHFDRVVQKAADESYKTCETCGKPGVLRSDLWWMKTLCQNCYETLEAPRKPPLNSIIKKDIPDEAL